MLAIRLNRQLSNRASPLLVPTALSQSRRSFWYNVRASGVQSVSAPIADSQKLQKTWTVSGSRPLDKLQLSAPGLAYVSVVDDLPGFAHTHGLESSGSLVAVVRATSNSREALERVDVTSKFPYRTLVGFDGYPTNSSASSGLSEAHLLTEIVLPRSSLLSRLVFTHAGDVVVDSTSLATVDRSRKGSVRLAAGVNRRVFVTASSEALDRVGLRFGDLKLATWMGGQVRIMAPHVSAQGRVSVSSAGDDTVVMIDTGAFLADQVRVDVAGGSEVAVVADEIATGYLCTRIVGGGNVSMKLKTPTDDTSAGTNASCECQEIAIGGKGTVDASDLATLVTRVRIAGKGGASVRASDLLTVEAAGEAAVSYSGSKPRIVQSFGVPITVQQREHASAGVTSSMDAGDVPSMASAFDPKSKLVIDAPWYGHYYHHWWRSPRRFGRYYGCEGSRFGRQFDNRYGWHRQRRWSRWGDFY